MHVTACELHSCPKVYEVPFVSKVYDRYPKSLISSGSSTGTQKPRKLSIPAPIATKLHTGRYAGKALKPISISQTYRKGCSLYKLCTPLRVRTQNRNSGTGTGSAHGDFASHVYVATRPCMCTVPDGQLRIHDYM